MSTIAGLLNRSVRYALGAVCFATLTSKSFATEDPEASFRLQVQPLIQQYCSDCHADGANKGGIAFDELKTREALLDPHFWEKVLKNVRSGIMPPPKKPQPSPVQKHQLETWIKTTAF